MSNANEFEIMLGATINDDDLNNQLGRILGKVQENPNTVIAFRTEAQIDRDSFRNVENFIDLLRNSDVKINMDYSQLYDAYRSAENLRNGLDKISQSADAMFKRFGQNVISAFFTQIETTVRECIQSIAEFDEAIFNLQVVTGGTREEASQLLNTYNQMAQSLGSTTTAVAETANEFLRQGLSQSETNDMIVASQYLSKLGMIESADATQYLTSATKGYGIEASNAMSIVDKFTNIDMHAAVSAGYMAEAFSHTSASAQQAGVDFDTLAGYIATVGETTQKTSSVVGEAFKSMFARYSNVKAGNFAAEGENMENLNNVETVLKSIGIQIRETSGTYRDFSDVLDDVAGRWDSLSQVEQNAIATAMGGTYQRENFLVLMQNYDQALELTATSMNSAGTAAEKYQAYQESLDAALNRVTSTLDTLATSVAGSGFLTGLVNVGNEILKVVTHAEVLIPLLSAIGMTALQKAAPGIIMLGKGIATFATNLKKGNIVAALFGNTIKNFKAPLAAIGNQFEGLTKAQASYFLQQQGYTKVASDFIVKQMAMNREMYNTSSGLFTAKAGVESFTVGMKSASAAVVRLSIAMDMLQKAMIIFTIISAIVQIIQELIPNVQDTIDDLNDKIDKSNNRISEQTQKVQELQNQIDTLNEKKTETTDENDLKLLDRQISLLETRAKVIQASIDAEAEFQLSLLNTLHEVKDTTIITDAIREDTGKVNNFLDDIANAIGTFFKWLDVVITNKLTGKEIPTFEEYIEQVGYINEEGLTQIVHDIEGGLDRGTELWLRYYGSVERTMKSAKEALADGSGDVGDYIHEIQKYAYLMEDTELYNLAGIAMSGNAEDMEALWDYIESRADATNAHIAGIAQVAEQEAGTIAAAKAKAEQAIISGVDLTQDQIKQIEWDEILSGIPDAMKRKWQEGLSAVSSEAELKSTDPDLYDEIANYLSSMGASTDEISQLFAFATDSSKMLWDSTVEGANDAADAIDEAKSSLDDFQNALDDFSNLGDKFETLENAFKEFQNYGGVSASTMSEMISAYGTDAIPLIQSMADGTFNLGDAESYYTNKAKQAIIQTYLSANASNEASGSNANLEGSSYGAASGVGAVGSAASSNKSNVSGYGTVVQGASSATSTLKSNSSGVSSVLSGVGSSASSAAPGLNSFATSAFRAASALAAVKSEAEVVPAIVSQPA